MMAADTSLPRTGYAQHGDYVFGWQDDTLQRAMDAGCFGATCRALTTQSFDKANRCSVKPQVREDNDGCKYSLMKTQDTENG